MIDADSTVRKTVARLWASFQISAGAGWRCVFRRPSARSAPARSPQPWPLAASSPRGRPPTASAKIGLKWSKAQAVVEAVRVGDAPDGAQVLDRAVLRRELDAERGHSPRYRRTRGSPGRISAGATSPAPLTYTVRSRVTVRTACRSGRGRSASRPLSGGGRRARYRGPLAAWVSAARSRASWCRRSLP
jgi:hypothetical protein